MQASFLERGHERVKVVILDEGFQRLQSLARGVDLLGCGAQFGQPVAEHCQNSGVGGDRGLGGPIHGFQDCGEESGPFTDREVIVCQAFGGESLAHKGIFVPGRQFIELVRSFVEGVFFRHHVRPDGAEDRLPGRVELVHVSRVLLDHIGSTGMEQVEKGWQRAPGVAVLSNRAQFLGGSGPERLRQFFQKEVVFDGFL